MELSTLFSKVSAVSPRRLAAALLTGALVGGLVLGASLAQAQTVETDASGNVTRILGLTVTEDQGGTTVYDVDFLNGPASTIYPNRPDDFPFRDEGDKIEDAFNALAQVLDALNVASPVPPGASTAGTSQFFIPVETEGGTDFILTVGGQNIGGLWAVCQAGCQLGTNSIGPEASVTYAVFSPAGGGEPGTCAAPVASPNAYDFNGDGTGDILWRNSVSGEVTVWLLDGSGALLQQGSLGGVQAPWKIVGVGDVDGDGKADIVWREQAPPGTPETAQANVVLWFMDGVTIKDIALPGGTQVVWEIDEVSDQNCDGKADFVWRNTTTGAVAQWFMDGGAILPPAGDLGVVGTDWEIQPMAPTQQPTP